MKNRKSLVRFEKFQVDECRRRVQQIESMIEDFENKAQGLDEEIQAEQDRCRIDDVNHYAYPAYARAAMQRRDNMRASASELRSSLDDARATLQSAVERLKKSELLGERGQQSMRRRAHASEQTMMDEAGARQVVMKSALACSDYPGN